ncbi:hypothetical protein EJB05_42223 [Eragrostis curvula]|uniref:DUF3615 domain-containing protein n=1 Tax=Eragrostis curvula TaxID=38414 RepID=A0A5J9TCV4_9POAL|nr:hypothetical protein EJB05_42223 [Eragrostis curvula]
METPLPVYEITVDDEGFFNPCPYCPGSPFRSFTEVAAAIKRVHFPGPPGVVAIVQLYGETIPIEGLVDPPPRPKEYYFTMKKGLFHVHPDGLGGPYNGLSDAAAAVQHHQESLKPPPFDWEKEGREQMQRMINFLYELDPAEYIPVMAPPQTELHKHPKEDANSSTDDSELSTCDPVLLEAIELFERLEAEEDGMKWMKKEAIQAFKSYLSSIETKGVKYKFQKLDYQCLVYDSYPKVYHHYNFTMNIKMPLEKHWVNKPFFAEVVCFGCSKSGVRRLRHPANGGYEEGNLDSGFPFDTCGDSD